MFFASFFSSLGGSLGSSFGGGILSAVGRYIGGGIGRYFDEENYSPAQYFNYKKQLEFLFLASDVLNTPIVLVFGKGRVCGQMIWSKPILEKENDETSLRYFGRSGVVKSINHNISYSYFANFALSICEGPVQSIERVWAGGKLIDLSCYEHTLYYGGIGQEPDPLILEDNGQKTCAFRDLAYIVFKNLPLADFDNKIPLFEFEVTRQCSTLHDLRVEERVKSIMMIPGSGEFVYDPNLQYKIHKMPDGTVLKKEVINSHNHKGVADSIYSMDQLQQVCPNVESIGLVIGWFGDSLNIRDCSIMPAVEYGESGVVASQEWRVAAFKRSSARRVQMDGYSPRYGGTVNDASLLGYLRELKRRTLKVALYPMFFMDLPGKPWRGHVSGAASDVSDFFNKKCGYNNFILHYAELTKGLVDVFIIGSELKGITSIYSGDGHFPAVSELVLLAKKVKHMVGSAVKVSYAADWSEYHHTSGGWFNLDPLWASEDIDFVGIDVYFPVSSSVSSKITDQQILQGWSSGEGFDYYIDADGKHVPLKPEYAWKNFSAWWSGQHINPDGVKTAWRGKMKKIWFTEFGYPSIDKASNQPNVFFDPKCIDGGVPRHSNGRVDFAIQRRCIDLALQRWGVSQMVEEMYLWTWDARPYPAWPNYGAWSDGYLWRKGHWVNNKFGIVTLAGVIAQLCLRAGILPDKIDVSGLDVVVEGVVFSKVITAIEAIGLLRCGYFFDMYYDGEVLVFKKRGVSDFADIYEADLIRKKEGESWRLYDASSLSSLRQISVTFFNQAKKYALDSAYASIEPSSSSRVHFLHLPIVMQETQAYELAEVIARNSFVESRLLKFSLPARYIYICPSDTICFNLSGSIFYLRIVEVAFQDNILQVAAFPEDIEVYQLSDKSTALELRQEEELEELQILNLPHLPWLDGAKRYLHLVYFASSCASLYVSLDKKSFAKLADLSGTSCIGRVLSFENFSSVSRYLIDKKSKFIIYSKSLLQSLGDDEFFTKANFAYISGEIMRFKNARLIARDTYEISWLIRGEAATELLISSHAQGGCFALIGKGLVSIEFDEAIVGREILLKVDARQYKFRLHDNGVNASGGMVYDDWIQLSS